MKFTKMHGCGNDYIYINGFTENVADKTAFVKAVSDRHFGVGGDGAIFINPSDEADFEMEMYNADGTRAEMCGNGIRCVAKYVYDTGLTNQTEISIISCGKIKYVTMTVTDSKVSSVRVNMGEPQLVPQQIPVEGVFQQEALVLQEPIEILGKTYHMTCVSMGNPHAVYFWNQGADQDKWEGKTLAEWKISEFGPYFENHPCFPNRTNSEFVEIVDRNHVNMRVWERGTGETLACGTGCSAVAVAGVLNGFTDRKVTVNVLGGSIEIEWDEKTNCVFMTGPAVTVFEGEYDWPAQ